MTRVLPVAAVLTAMLAVTPAMAETAEERLDAVLEAQSDEVKARYEHRHPKETLTFFGVEPGMTVVDTLPGEPGWYSEILVDYLGPDGTLIGADYSLEMWGVAGRPDEWLEERASWPANYVAGAEEAGGEDGASVLAHPYGTFPEELNGTVDAVLMIRATHHFNRLEAEGGTYTAALADAMALLKPGGVLGVVQHRASEDLSDESTTGGRGYVKQSHVIDFVTNAGFEFVEESEINANPNDEAGEQDIVWRLPPTLATSRDNEELRAQMEAIGESDRMTLKFVKPAE